MSPVPVPGRKKTPMGVMNFYCYQSMLYRFRYWYEFGKSYEILYWYLDIMLPVPGTGIQKKLPVGIVNFYCLYNAGTGTGVEWKKFYTCVWISCYRYQVPVYKKSPIEDMNFYRSSLCNIGTDTNIRLEER
jgi:hypothetical protein